MDEAVHLFFEGESQGPGQPADVLGRGGGEGPGSRGQVRAQGVGIVPPDLEGVGRSVLGVEAQSDDPIVTAQTQVEVGDEAAQADLDLGTHVDTAKVDQRQDRRPVGEVPKADGLPGFRYATDLGGYHSAGTLLETGPGGPGEGLLRARQDRQNKASR
jgi:hypothetical protein